MLTKIYVYLRDFYKFKASKQLISIWETNIFKGSIFMNSKNLINFINKIVLSSLVLIISMAAVNANPAKASEEQKKIIGVWQLKGTDKRAKHLKPEFSPVPVDFAPASLVLAADDEVSEITINEEFDDFVNTQTLPTDGTPVTKNIALIGKVSSKAYWADKKLVVEILTDKGDKITETFEISPNQKQLIVNLQMSNNRSAKTTKMKRVYNRVAEQSGDNTAQVGITVYPF
jgi:hypothetical protein